jgi:hypothetical protein
MEIISVVLFGAYLIGMGHGAFLEMLVNKK